MSAVVHGGYKELDTTCLNEQQWRMAGKSISFQGTKEPLTLSDFSHWTPCSQNLFCCWDRRKIKAKTLHYPSILHLVQDPYNSQVLVTPDCPSPLLGRDFLSAWGWLLLSMKTKSKKCFPLCYVLYKTWTVHPKYSPKKWKTGSPENPRDV